MRTLLCNYCIQAIRSRGETVKIVEPNFITAEEAEELNTEETELINRHIINPICCDWCGEVDTLHSCEF